MHRLYAALFALLALVVLPGCDKIESAVFTGEMKAEHWRTGVTPATITVDDIQWSYLHNEWKDGQPTIVLLHGFTADKETWTRFIGELGDGYNVIAPDLPGHGDTSHAMDLHYDIDTQARRVLSLMQTLKVEKFHLAGNSMGGAISVRAAWLAPGNVESVGLFNAAGVHMKDSEFDAELKKGNNPLVVRKEGDLETVFAWAMAEPPFLPWPAKSVFERRQIERAALYDKIFKDLTRDNGIDQTTILPEVVARTLVLWGDKDRLLDVANADLFASSMPNTKKVIMTGIGHAPMLEAPAESAKIYRDFLAGY